MVCRFQLNRYLHEYFINDKLLHILVNCPAPFRISVSLYNQNKILISWLRNKCNNTVTWLYIYYKDITTMTSVWEWKGIPSDSQNFVLSDLVPFHQYKAYLLAAMSNGNSLPSTVFFIQAPGKGLIFF